MMFYNKNCTSGQFRVDGSDVTLTKSAVCAQKLGNVSAESYRHTKHQFPRYIARTPTAEAVWGMNRSIYIYKYI